MADFDKATRAAWDRGFKNQVALSIPLFAMLYEHHRIIFKGGNETVVTMQKGTTEGLSQAYFMNEPLSGGRTDVLEQATFKTKYMQHPVQYDGRDVVENKGGVATAPLDTIKLVTEISQDGFKRALQALFWTAGSDSHTESNSRNFTSVPQALTHDVPYGGLERTIGSSTNDWFQGASPGTIYTDQGTAVAPSLANIAVWADVCRRHTREGLDGRGNARNQLYMFVPEGIFQDIRVQAEAKSALVKPSKMAFKYGFQAINVHDVEIVKSSWMTLANSAGYTDRSASICMLSPETWQFRVSPDRRFRHTPFIWQGEHSGGIDAYMARILLAGTLTCKMPRANMLLLAVA